LMGPGAWDKGEGKIEVVEKRHASLIDVKTGMYIWYCGVRHAMSFAPRSLVLRYANNVSQRTKWQDICDALLGCK
jgi:hypothetical protein